MKIKRINGQVAIEIISYLLFSVVLLYSVITNKYLSYVSPKTKPYIIFAAIIFLIFAGFSIKDIYIKQYKKHTLHCITIIIPILLIILSPGKMTNISGSTSNGFLKGNTTSNVVSTDKNSSESQESTEDASSKEQDQKKERKPDTYESKDSYGNTIYLHGYEEDKKSITVNNDEFLLWLNAIFNNTEYFTGWNITITGSVLKEDSFTDKEFVSGRLVMTCCVADLVPCGFVCHYNDAKSLAVDTWVTVTGTIIIGQYDGQNEPQIDVSSVKSAEAVSGYLYP